jgi:menaquinone-dependent protoporphyrinogen IX oxidase
METQQQEVTTTTVTPQECALFAGLVKYEEVTWADVAANDNGHYCSIVDFNPTIT